MYRFHYFFSHYSCVFFPIIMIPKYGIKPCLEELIIF